MNAISDFLQSFNPISLPEMDKVQLLDRRNTKHIFHINQLEEVLNKCNIFYNILPSISVGSIRKEHIPQECCENHLPFLPRISHYWHIKICVATTGNPVSHRIA